MEEDSSQDLQPDVATKRGRTDEADTATPAPKASKRTHDNPLDDNILDKKIGTYTKSIQHVSTCA